MKLTTKTENKAEVQALVRGYILRKKMTNTTFQSRLWALFALIQKVIDGQMSFRSTP